MQSSSLHLLAGVRRVIGGSGMLAAAVLGSALWDSATLHAQAAASATAEPLCAPQVIGNRRYPKESILARLFSRAGNPYDEATVERDFNSLWNSGYFEDVRIEKADGRGVAHSSSSMCARSRPSGPSNTKA